MWVDVDRLAKFYKSQLGTVVHRAVTQSINNIWPETHGQNIAGLGYALPYLGLFEDGAGRILSLMPGAQGATAWPPGRPNCTVLVEETMLPLPDRCLDKVLVVHAFEYAHTYRDLLKECWRVLVDYGEILIVTPNRRGAWSQVTNTPLGYGTPYTGHQLFDILKECDFTPMHPEYCLYTPPSTHVFRMRISRTLEKLGARFYRKFGGVLLFPAKKQVACITPRVTAPAHRELWKPLSSPVASTPNKTEGS